MSIHAVNLQPWEFISIDCSEEYRTVTENEEERYERRSHYTINLRRRVIGVLAFGEDTGKSSTGFGGYVGPDYPLSFNTGSRKWRCSRDALIEDVGVVGAYVNEQAWEHYTEWDEVQMSEFG